MARECPNERSRLNCILCGKDTHDSFDCHEKLCFKCNKAGHIANDCEEKNITKCSLCNQIGHSQQRCLRVWENTQDESSKGRYSHKNKHDQFKRCIECGKSGHFKCTKENRSRVINLTFHVEDNLDEFFVTESSPSSDE